MAHSHGYIGSQQGLSEKRLSWATGLNFLIAAAEVVGGLLSNSLALLSDALHNLSDAFALLIALIANKVSKRSTSEKQTFGYKRIEILAALFNAVVLIAISFYLFYEAFQRFLQPEEINSTLMLFVAAIGLAANLIAIFLLKKDAKHNLNVKAAYLHLLGDTFSSVAVIAGGLLMYFFQWYWFDPLITVIIGLYILKETWSILRETIQILMQATPEEINFHKINKRMLTLPEVSNLHHVHAWKLTDKEIHFEGHVEVKEDLPVSKLSAIREQMEKILMHEFNIAHVTIQFEYNECDPKDLIAKK